MHPPRSQLPYRNLAALERSASTTRVLNLARLSISHGRLPEHSEAPFFLSSRLNRAIILKHRLRPDDPVLTTGRRVATKVIIPIDPTNLALGGASFFVAEAGWLDILDGLCDGPASFDRDRDLLESLDQLPSLDPFLMREFLRRRQFRPADCYFAISPSDRHHMSRFVEAEIDRLIRLAYEGRDDGSTGAARLVEILLASHMDERLEPLRQTLRLEGDSYREGVFSWKGFLYYKWSLTTLWPRLREVVAELGKLEVSDRANRTLAAHVAIARTELQRAIQLRCCDIEATLETYDQAFARLTEQGDAAAFRDFLLRAPAMFLELGERVGLIAHIASFWRYRFPVGSTFQAGEEEILDLFRDFETGLALPSLHRAA